MTSKKVIELFYDVVSPYSWLGFEVCFHYVGYNNKITGLVTSKTLNESLIISDHVSLPKRVEHRAETAPCFSGWRHAWIRYMEKVAKTLWSYTQALKCNLERLPVVGVATNKLSYKLKHKL